MYNIADLNAMSPEQLKDIASSMGLKKVDINDKNSLVFGILDKQAEDMVASAAEKKRNSAKDQPSAKKSNAKKQPRENKSAADTDKSSDKNSEKKAAPAVTSPAVSAASVPRAMRQLPTTSQPRKLSNPKPRPLPKICRLHGRFLPRHLQNLPRPLCLPNPRRPTVSPVSSNSAISAPRTPR